MKPSLTKDHKRQIKARNTLLKPEGKFISDGPEQVS